MKNILLILVLLIFLGCSNLKHLNEFYGFKSNPKSIQIDKFKYENGQEEFKTRTLIEFDRKGRIITHQSFKSDKTPSGGGWEYKYDKFGNVIEQNLLLNNGSYNVKNIYKFNNDGQEVFREYISGSRRIETKSTYDENGNLKEVVGKYPGGKFGEHSIFEYNSQGEKTALISYNSDGSQKSKFEFRYDENGNQIESKRYNAENELQSFTKYSYNKVGDIISTKSYIIKDGQTELINFGKNDIKYDERGNYIEKKLLVDDVPVWLTVQKIKYWK